MITMLSVLAGIGLLATVINLSLLPKWQLVFPLCLAIAIGVYAIHPWVSHVNIHRVYDLMNVYDLITLISIYLICEGLCSIVSSHILTAQRENDDTACLGLWPGQAATAWVRRQIRSLFGYLTYLPSGMLLIALAVWQAQLFHTISDVPFNLIASAQAGVVITSLVVGSWFVRKLMSQWYWRVEIKILLAMFQIGIAMFLPVMASNTRVAVNPYQVDLWGTLIVLAVFSGMALLGLGAQRLKTKHFYSKT